MLADASQPERRIAVAIAGFDLRAGGQKQARELDLAPVAGVHQWRHGVGDYRIDVVAREILFEKPDSQRGIHRRRGAGDRPVAPALVTAVETVSPGEAGIGEIARVILAGMAVIAIDQHRPVLWHIGDKGGEIGGRHGAGAVDMARHEGSGVADVENCRRLVPDQLFGFLESDALKATWKAARLRHWVCS